MDEINRKIDENLKMEDWLKEKYIEEARRVEKEVLEKDDVLPDDQIDVDASFERLMMKMKARGIYPEDAPDMPDTIEGIDLLDPVSEAHEDIDRERRPGGDVIEGAAGAAQPSRDGLENTEEISKADIPAPRKAAKPRNTIINMHEAAAELREKAGSKHEPAVGIRNKLPSENKSAVENYDGLVQSRDAVSRKRRKTDRGIYRFMSYFTKAAAIVLVAGCCIFGVSMTSEANRNYIIDSFNILVGNDVQVNVVNSEDRDTSGINEIEAIKKIEDTLGITVPIFMYRPKQFEFDSYYLDRASNVVNVHYMYQNKWVITLNIIKLNENSSSSVIFQSDLIGTTSVMSNNEIKVDLYKVKKPTDKRASYVAKWNVGDVYYQLSGKLEEGEMRQLVEQMEC